MDLIVTFLNITVQIMVVAHYIGCFMFAWGMEEFRGGNTGWVKENSLLDETTWTKYITSIYWAFTTMSAVGYGDIVPITKLEKTITMAAMITSCGTFAYTVNSIGNIVKRFNMQADTYGERMKYVNQYMTMKDMPGDLKTKVRRYLDYKFD